MSRKSREFRPTLDGKLEDRIALSGGGNGFGFFRQVPVLTSRAFNEVLKQVDRAFVQFSRTPGGPLAQLRLQRTLQAQTFHLPYGGRSLAPLIPSTLEGVTPFNAGAYRAEVREGLASYVREGALNGTFALRRS